MALRAFLARVALSAASISITLVLVDRALGFAGFPREISARVSHPPNYKEIRNNLEFSYEFETNSQGLRYPEIPLQKPSGSYRVFVLGDSFTEGVGVSEDQRFSALLEQHFGTNGRRIAFVNGGLAGTGPLEYGRLFLSIGLEYDPDAVLICLYANDLSNSPVLVRPGDLSPSTPNRAGIKRLAHSFLPHMYTLVNSSWDQLQFERRTRTSDFVETISIQAMREGIPERQIRKWSEVLHEYWVDAVNRGEFNGAMLSYGLLRPKYWSDALDIDSEISEAKWQSMATIISELVSESRRREIEVAIVYLPTRFQYDPPSHELTNPWILSGTNTRRDWLIGETEIQIRLESLTKEMDVPFYDLTSVFREAALVNSNLNWALDDHWTAEGHRTAGSAIAEWLEESGAFSIVP